MTAEPLASAPEEAPEASAAPRGAAAESPYKFLDYFTDTPEDRRRFGGRDREIREIVARVTNERTLVLYGPSGIGKTSLLLAGVFPALRERGYRPVHIRTLTSPLADVQRGVAALCPDGSREDESLHSLLARVTQEGPAVLVLDQFEELFIRFRDRPEERRALVGALASVVADRAIDVSILFSLREDYLASLDELGNVVPQTLADRYRLHPLTAFGVRQAVTRPLLDVGTLFEPAIVSRLIAQLEDVDFEPPLLQILCTEVYKEAFRRTRGVGLRITVADLDRLGGRDGIFRRYLDGVTQALPAERHLLARMILDALITSEGTKRAVTLPDLLRSGFTAEEGEVREILEALNAQRLLRREERNGEDWYELIHERLVPALQEWLDLDRQFFEFRQARTFVRNNGESDLWHRRPDALLSSGVLDSLLGPCRERFRFSQRELELVTRSALYRRSGELPFWAERFGLEETKEFLFSFLASEREQDRLAAVGSARRLEDRDGRLAAACLRAALEDGSEAVRREAGLSLAPLAGSAEIDALRAAWRQRGLRRERAREALAAMKAGGNALAAFGRRDRWLARRREERRVLGELGTALRRRWMTGTAAGAAAAASWEAGTTGIVELADWLRGPATYQPLLGKWPDLFRFLLGLGGVALLGALIGWMVSLAAAKDAALKGEGRWLASLFGSPLLCGLWLLLFLWGGTTDVVAESMSGWKIAGLLGFSVLVGFSALAWAAWGRVCVWPDVPRRWTWLGSLLVSLGWPVLAVLVAITAIRKTLDPFFLAGGVLGTGADQISFVILVSLALSASRHPLGEAPPVQRARRWRRLAGSAAAVAIIPFWIGHFYGWESLVPVVHDYIPGRTLPLAWSPGPNRVDPPLFELSNATGRLQIVEIDREVDPVHGLAAVKLGGYDDIWKGMAIPLPPGRFQGRFRLYSPPKGIPHNRGDNRGATFSLVPSRNAPRFDPRNLKGLDDFTSDWLAPEPVPGEPGRWRIELSGRLEKELIPPGLELGQYRIRVSAWCEALEPRSGTKLTIHARRQGVRLAPNEVPPRVPRLPGLEVLADQEVAVPLGRKLSLGPQNLDTDAVNWFLKPDGQGRWSLEIRLRELPARGASREEASGIGRVYVQWGAFPLPE